MNFDQLRRRDLITLLGGAAAWPIAARAQSIPIVGVLGAASPVPYITAAIADGLRENGYTEGRNVRIAYRWAAGAYDRLPGLADELVRLPADVIVTLGTPAARPAKAASIKVSPAVPMVFVLGADPVAEGLVASLNRLVGNVTGSTSIGGSLAPKRLEIIGAFLGRDVPAAILINPDNPLGGAERAEAEQAARAVGRPLVVLSARDRSEIEASFAALKPRGAGALIIAVDTFYFAQMRWMAELAAAYKTPASAWTIDAPDAVFVFFDIYVVARCVAHAARDLLAAGADRKGKRLRQAAAILKYYDARRTARFASFEPTQWQRAHPH